MANVEMKQKIEKIVLKILSEADFDVVSPAMVRKQASEEIGLNLSKDPFKALVRQIIDDFVQQLKDKEKEKEEEEEEEEKEEEEEEDDEGKRRYDDFGNIFICQLGKHKKLTINEYNGQTNVSIRNYYYNKGKEVPSRKGISLTVNEWLALKELVPAIENGIQEMKARV